MRFLSLVTVLATRPNWRSRANWLRLGAFLASLAIMGAAFLLHEKLDLDKLAYGGLGFTVLLASGGLVLPIPSLAAACAAGAALNPVYVGLVAGSAGTLGELTGYFLGYSGRGVLDRSRLYQRMEGWMRGRGWLLLFLVSLIPNPIFDVIGIAAGALRYPVWRFLGVVWVGKLLKFLMIAYSCAYSIDWLTDVFVV
jgi:membrane protein YqaA with SNARE-associated domain